MGKVQLARESPALKNWEAQRPAPGVGPKIARRRHTPPQGWSTQLRPKDHQKHDKRRHKFPPGAANGKQHSTWVKKCSSRPVASILVTSSAPLPVISACLPTYLKRKKSKEFDEGLSLPVSCALPARRSLAEQPNIRHGERVEKWPEEG